MARSEERAGDRVFLDATVLFSAAYRPDAGVSRLWRLAGVELLSSAYAIEEARRNLATPAQRDRLEQLLATVHTVPEPEDSPLREGLRLPEKDRPIYLAARSAGATHLVTGDVTHFGPYLGQRIAGLRVLTPRNYLAKHG